MENDLLIAGDFCPLNRLVEPIASGNRQALFTDVLPVIASSSLAILNLECPLSGSFAAITKTGPALQANRKAAELLVAAGFKLVTLANNHIMDYGPEGLNNTLSACESARLATIGAGANRKVAGQAHSAQIGTRQISILNFAENEFSTTQGPEPGANPVDPIQNSYDIQEAARHSDYVVVIVHGGHEMYNLPSPGIRKLFRFYADAGAHVVVGHHPHCYSGYEIYKGKPLFYSLGNFLFDDPAVRNRFWHSGFMVGFRFGEVVDFRIYPYFQCRTFMGVELMKGSDLDDFFKDLERLNGIIGDSQALEQAFADYCVRVERRYRAFLEPFSWRWLRVLQRNKILPDLLSVRKKRLYLNLMRCEAHREVLIHLLKQV